MAKRPIPDEVTDNWFEPLLNLRHIRRDLTKYLRTARKGDMLAAAEGLRRYDRPALVVWATEDRVMPPDHGRRLAELLPQGQLVQIPDSYTLIPEDQPGLLARAIQQFIHDTPVAWTGGRGSARTPVTGRSAGEGTRPSRPPLTTQSERSIPA